MSYQNSMYVRFSLIQNTLNIQMVLKLVPMKLRDENDEYES